MKLTEMEIRNAKPRIKPYKMGDGGGMYIKVMPNGSKYWRQKYQVNGKEKTLTHGVYPHVSLADARIYSDEARKLLEKGIDPYEHCKATKATKSTKATKTIKAPKVTRIRKAKGSDEDILKRAEEGDTYSARRALILAKEYLCPRSERSEYESMPYGMRRYLIRAFNRILSGESAHIALNLKEQTLLDGSKPLSRNIDQIHNMG